MTSAVRANLQSYLELCNETALDTYRDSMATVFGTFTGAAANTTPVAELRQRATEVTDVLMFLAMTTDGLHVFHNFVNITPSLTNPNARHVGEVAAIMDDLGSNGRLNYALVPVEWWHRVNVRAGTAAHIDAEFVAAGDDPNALVPAGAAGAAEYEDLEVRHLQPVDFPLAALAMANVGCTPREAWTILGGYITSHPQPDRYEHVQQWLRAAVTQGTPATQSRVARPMPAAVMTDTHFESLYDPRLRMQLPAHFDPTVRSQATQPQLVSAVRSLENATVAVVQTTNQTLQSTQNTTKSLTDYYGTRIGKVLVTHNAQDVTQVEPHLTTFINTNKKEQRTAIQDTCIEVAERLGLPYVPVYTPDMKDEVLRPVLVGAGGSSDWFGTVATVFSIRVYGETSDEVLQLLDEMDRHDLAEEHGRDADRIVSIRAKWRFRLRRGETMIYQLGRQLVAFTSHICVKHSANHPFAKALYDKGGLIELWEGLGAKLREWCRQDPLAPIKVMGLFHNKMHSYMEQMDKIRPDPANPAYNLPPLPDFAGLIQRLKDGEVQYASVTVPLQYLETPTGPPQPEPEPTPTRNQGPSDADLKGWAQLPRAQLTTKQLNAVLKSKYVRDKKPSDTTFVLNDMTPAKTAAVIRDVGLPPAGVNGETCFAFTFGGNCPYGHLCNRVADHKPTAAADKAARAQYVTKVKAAGHGQ